MFKIGNSSLIESLKWYVISLIKLIVGVVTIVYIGKSALLGVLGVIAILLFAWEQFTEYKRLSKL